jgi:Transposase DDE domain group 1
VTGTGCVTTRCCDSRAMPSLSSQPTLSRFENAITGRELNRLGRAYDLGFDALSGQLITALLRPGRAHAAMGALTVLTRLLRANRRRCPHVSILIRGDSAFAMPKLLERLEQLRRRAR